jgi:hypothetical protein
MGKATVDFITDDPELITMVLAWMSFGDLPEEPVVFDRHVVVEECEDEG